MLQEAEHASTLGVEQVKPFVAVEIAFERCAAEFALTPDRRRSPAVRGSFARTDTILSRCGLRERKRRCVAGHGQPTFVERRVTSLRARPRSGRARGGGIASSCALLVCPHKRTVPARR